MATRLMYFDRGVLEHYKHRSHLYRVDESAIGGEIDGLQDGFWLRFGFRRTEEDSICVVILDKDFLDIPDGDQSRWKGYKLSSATFASEDPKFRQWWEINFEVSYDDSYNYIERVRNKIRTINAITNQKMGEPLWKKHWHDAIHYPVAENHDSYANAHMELYRLLVDSLNAKAIQGISAKSGANLTDTTKNMSSFKEMLPASIVKEVNGPIRECSLARNKKHGIPSIQSMEFPAFAEFHRYLGQLSVGLASLEHWLEELFGVSAEACRDREVTMEGYWPHFSGPPWSKRTEPTFQKAEGKTIQRIEVGTDHVVNGVEAEALVLHFTDGTALAIMVNAEVKKLTGLLPEDVNPPNLWVGLGANWAPSISGNDETNQS
jgi:hypothetical protein